MTKEKAITDFIAEKVGVSHASFDVQQVHVDPNPRSVKTQYNAQAFPKYQEVNKQPSQTVPNQTMSLKTILERYAKGLPITGNPNEPVYYGDENMPDLNKMDISEIHDLKEAVKSDIKEKQAQLAADQETARQKAHQKSIDDEVEKRLSSKSKKDPDNPSKA